MVKVLLDQSQVLPTDLLLQLIYLVVLQAHTDTGWGRAPAEAAGPHKSMALHCITLRACSSGAQQIYLGAATCALLSLPFKPESARCMPQQLADATETKT